MRLTAVDLFAGAGGLGLGLAKAGFTVIAANEYNPVFARSYALNHPTTRVVTGDILDQQVFEELIPVSKEVDLVAGGPPCQGFSTVGKKDEGDPRNKLFYTFLRLIETVRPRAVLFENVSGFKRLYQGRAYHALVENLSGLGYHTHHRILNAKDFGVPQSRERTFVVAFRENSDFEFPYPTHSNGDSLFVSKRSLTLEDALSDLPVVQQGEMSTAYASDPQNDYQKTMREKSNGNLTEHVGPNHGPRLMNVISKVPNGGSILDIPLTLRPKSYFLNTYARLWWDRPSTTITRNFGTPSSSRCIHPLVDRGLTTREGARLQSFPDWYRFVGSRSEKNLQIGNAVPPFLAMSIAKAIQRYL